MCDLFRFNILCAFWFSLNYFVLLLFVFVVLGLVSSILHQEIGLEECLRNDILCRVGCKTLTHSMQKWLNRSRCCVECEHGCAQGTVQIAPCEGASFRGKDMPRRARRHAVMSCSKMAEPIKILLNTIAPSICGGDAPFCQITLTTCYGRPM